jgi:hypothetical protein
MKSIYIYSKCYLIILSFIFSIFSSTAWAMLNEFSDEEQKQTLKTKKKDKNSENCKGDCETKDTNCTSALKKDVQNKKTNNRIWYDGGCCKGGCSTQVNTYPVSQKGYYENIGRYKLFRSSFLNGAAYTLVPEICRDVLEYKGYSRASKLVPTLVQGGMIAYNSSSYLPTITGILVRTGSRQLGFSERDSTIAASTAAVITTLSQKLIFSKDTAVDCIVDVAIGLIGSFTGSALVLKAKSWVYNLFGY